MTTRVVLDIDEEALKILSKQAIDAGKKRKVFLQEILLLASKIKK